jgi:chromosome partitioning protein
MKTISLVNRKGGVGKTSQICLLALYWAQKGKRVGVDDLDPQGSSSAVVEHWENDLITVYDGEEVDYLLIDTIGGIREKDLAEIIDLSDLVLIPLLLGPTDMRATGQTVRQIDATDKTRLVFNKVNTQTAIFKDRRNYAQAMGVKALKSCLSNRVAYGQALLDGWGALNTKAKTELSALGREIERIL